MLPLSPARKRILLEAAMSKGLRATRCWLPDLIHSQMATGNMARMAKDAMAKAYADKRTDDVTLYRNILEQISDYWEDSQCSPT